MDVSIIICTYNRAESLRQMLTTCCELEIPQGLQWELIVVDNNSTDDTKRLCESFGGKLPLRYLFEPRQGKSVALNRGIHEALASLLLFTDDDVDVDKHWLSNLWTAAARHPEVSFLGGRVTPRWERQPPRWLAEHFREVPMWGISLHFDMGEMERLLGADEWPFPGANLAIRRRAILNGFFFREDIGPTGDQPPRLVVVAAAGRALR